MSTALALANIFGNLTYVGLLLSGLWNARKRDDILRQERAFKLCALGAAAMLLVLGVNVVCEYWAEVAVIGFNLIVASLATYVTGKRCDQLEGIRR